MFPFDTRRLQLSNSIIRNQHLQCVSRACRIPTEPRRQKSSARPLIIYPNYCIYLLSLTHIDTCLLAKCPALVSIRQAPYHLTISSLSHLSRLKWLNSSSVTLWGDVVARTSPLFFVYHPRFTKFTCTNCTKNLLFHDGSVEAVFEGMADARDNQKPASLGGDMKQSTF